MERARLEQEAQRALDRGSPEAALAAYQALARLDPRDRRVRQKVAELLVRCGRTWEASPILRDLADGMARDGAHRAALALYRQLLGLGVDDPPLHMALAECLAASGNVADARTHWDTAARLWAAAGQSADAARAAQRVSEHAPGELALRVRVAELLEAAGDTDGAAWTYADVAAEYRRRGRADEGGRVAELALALRPGDLELLLDAARARLAQDAAQAALGHLQAAFRIASGDARVLDLLARAFEAAGQPDKAVRVLDALARAHADAGALEGEADALRRAARLAPGDARLAERLSAVEGHVARRARRLTDLPCAAPVDEAEMRAVVRAEVFLRCGFATRAAHALDALAERAGSPAMLAARAEVDAAAGRLGEAVSCAARLHAVAGDARDAVAERVRAWGGELPSAPTVLDLAEDAIVDDEIVDDAIVDDVIVDDLSVAGGVAGAGPRPPPQAEEGRSDAVAPGAYDAIVEDVVEEVVDTLADDVLDEIVEDAVDDLSVPDGAEARGDRLADAGDWKGALFAWREVLAEDPRNERVLGKIAGLRGRAASSGAAPVAPAPIAPVPVAPATVGVMPPAASRGEVVFAEVDPDSVAFDPSPVSADDDSAWDDLVDDVPALDLAAAGRALLDEGRNEDVLQLLEGEAGLAVATLRAAAHRAAGHPVRGLEALREAVAEASESDPDYPDALLELSDGYAATGKARLALRTLDELAALAPAHRAAEVAARRTALGG
ncbi:MAG: hypothetical protein RLZZ299_1206 [Pseudomonadota bacterium]|jgi:tetratricopeptide (TPR) repeat protein